MTNSDDTNSFIKGKFAEQTERSLGINFVTRESTNDEIRENLYERARFNDRAFVTQRRIGFRRDE